MVWVTFTKKETAYKLSTQANTEIKHMKKYMTAALISLVGFSTFVAAAENTTTNTPSEKSTKGTATTSAEPHQSTATSAPAVVNTGKGFYIGLGAGTGSYSATLTNAKYYIDSDGDNSSSNIKGDNLDGLDDTSSTTIAYAGYQFNKIIALEASYTDHGSYSGELGLNKAFKKNPGSIAVYANAGYSFLNGQLRPFGLLGLAYVDTKQSNAYERIDIDDTAVALHIGTGVEYFPTALRGVGFRLAYTIDLFTDNSYDVYEGDNGTSIKSTTLWQALDQLYVGIQYKF